jgi:hypothetical protein
MSAILFDCPTTGLRVQGWIVDYPIVQPEHDHEGYEPVTCPACERVHLVHPKTSEVLGAPVVRTVGYGERCTELATEKSKTAIDDLVAKRHPEGDW